MDELTAIAVATGAVFVGYLAWRRASGASGALSENKPSLEALREKRLAALSAGGTAGAEHAQVEPPRRLCGTRASDASPGPSEPSDRAESDDAVAPPSVGSTPPPNMGTTPPPSVGSTPPPSVGTTPPPSKGSTADRAEPDDAEASPPPSTDDAHDWSPSPASPPLPPLRLKPVPGNWFRAAPITCPGTRPQPLTFDNTAGEHSVSLWRVDRSREAHLVGSIAAGGRQVCTACPGTVWRVLPAMASGGTPRQYRHGVLPAVAPVGEDVYVGEGGTPPHAR